MIVIHALTTPDGQYAEFGFSDDRSMAAIRVDGTERLLTLDEWDQLVLQMRFAVDVIDDLTDLR